MISTSTAPGGTFTRLASARPVNEGTSSPSTNQQHGHLRRGGSTIFMCTADVSEEASRRLLPGNLEPELQHRAADARKEINDLFARADRDSDGLISIADVRRLFTRLDGGLPREALNMLLWKGVEEDTNYIDKDRFLDILVVLAQSITEDEDNKVALVTSGDDLAEISTILIGGAFLPSAPARSGHRDGSPRSPKLREGSPHRQRDSSVRQGSPLRRQASPGSCHSSLSRLPGVRDGGDEDRESSLDMKGNQRQTGELSKMGELSKALRQSRMRELRADSPTAPFAAKQGLSMSWPTPQRSGIRSGTAPRLLGPLAQKTHQVSVAPWTHSAVIGKSVEPLLPSPSPTSLPTPRHKANKSTARPSTPIHATSRFSSKPGRRRPAEVSTHFTGSQDDTLEPLAGSRSPSLSHLYSPRGSQTSPAAGQHSLHVGGRSSPAVGQPPSHMGGRSSPVTAGASVRVGRPVSFAANFAHGAHSPVRGHGHAE